MSLSDDLTDQLRKVKADWDELNNSIQFSVLVKDRIVEEGKRDSVVSVLGDLCRGISEVERLRSKAVGGYSQVLSNIPEHLLEFFRKEIEPNNKEISDLEFQLREPEVYEMFRDLLGDYVEEYAPNRRNIIDAFEHHAEKWKELIDSVRDADKWLAEDLESIGDRVREVINAPYFQPDLWSQNLTELNPILLGASSGTVPRAVTKRLQDIYRSFLFGNWISAIALTRSVLEYSILDNAVELKIETTHPTSPNKTAGLSTLITRVANRFDDLKYSMIYIRDCGDAVMHPEADRKIADMLMRPEARKIALKCIENIRIVVEKLYCL